MRNRIARYRREKEEQNNDYEIGCILLEKPFFLERSQWIPVPSDWNRNIVQGKSYDSTVEPGLTLWRRLQSAMPIPLSIREEAEKYGEPVYTLPRLGQGSFRIIVTDAYMRRCAVTKEKTLPALEAAHIIPYGEYGTHEVKNGILLRRDVHALFDKGYMTVTPDLHVEVSRRIKEDSGRIIHVPDQKSVQTDREVRVRSSCKQDRFQRP